MADQPTTDHASRIQELVTSPGGCLLLLLVEENGWSPADLAQPVPGFFAIAEAVGQLSPWLSGSDRLVTTVLAEGPRLRPLADDLVRSGDFDSWWAPIDLAHQLVLPQHDSFICPEEVWDLRPPAPPNPHERYAHRPLPGLTTSGNWWGLSPQLAFLLTQPTDWVLSFPLGRRAAVIRTAARVVEVTSAHDWHELARRYPADGFHAFHPDWPGTSWGRADGLVVPDWSAVAREYDGVHVTPWGFLTATRVRVTSDIGWTEPWVWDGPHTQWLNWVFDAIDDLSPVEQDTWSVPIRWPASVRRPG